MLTTLEGYGTSLDLILWEVLINESLVVVIEKNVRCWDERDWVSFQGSPYPGAPAVASAGPVRPTQRMGP